MSCFFSNNYGFFLEKIKILRKKEILNKQAQDIADELKEQRDQNNNQENKS